MVPLTLNLCLFFTAVASAQALRHARNHQNTVPLPTLLPPASFLAPIVSRTPRRLSKVEALRSLRSSGGASHIALLVGAQHDYEYLTNVTVGGQSFSVVVDTGSSDTWLAEKGFACSNLTGHPEPASTCAFGTHGFDSHLSRSYQKLPDSVFSIEYGDGEFLSGSVAFDTVTVGGLKVTHQEIGLVSSAAWVGDGISTGLLGLAYPALTSVKSKSHGVQMPYNPFFFNAVKQKSVAHPYFSLALNRGTEAGKHTSGIDPHLGFLAFGGIAPVPVAATAATVPVQAFTAGDRAPGTGPGTAFFFYAVDVQRYVFPHSAGVSTASNTTIIDSGTTLNLVPGAVAQAYNTGWGNVSWHDGLYYVDCDARAPPFAVVLGGATFTVDPRDQVIPVEADANGKPQCISGTQDGGPEVEGNVFILGDVFLHNVVVTFDIQKNRITFTQRENY
ncbi:acid protease [Mycena pura]|uniref:Acid protease n=1 Tax=Mycena pura TaxID=153505 RepID=A0AAD6YG66_9AGAR|nr:acid protease [Mycena pura]